MDLRATNTSSIVYQDSVAPIISRAMSAPDVRLSVTEPISEPKAKLAER